MRILQIIKYVEGKVIRALKGERTFVLKLRAVVAAGFILMVAGCDTYRPLDLPAKAALAPDLASLKHDNVSIDRPLTVDDVATLAVENGPVLLSERRQHGVADAQLVQAGLLPNPSFGPIYQFNTYAPNALNNAWTVSLTYDLRAVLLRPALRRSAQYASRQVDAQILWQEWQAMGQARLLAVDLIEGDRQLSVLERARRLYETRYEHSTRAMADQNATLATVIPDLTALQAARAAVQTLKRLQQTRQQQLDALLGLDPSVVIPLEPTPGLPPFDPVQVLERLPHLATFRPDLIALQMGYKSQDERVWAAILGQFPAFSFGLAGGIDNTHDYSLGPQPTFDLPIFNHNQGQIAIDRATRSLLHDQYQARLTAADGDVRAMLAAIALGQRQLDASRREIAANRVATDAATRAWSAGDLDELTYVNLVSAQITKEQQVLDLEQSVLDQQVAIATLTGAGLPPFTQAGSTPDDPHL